MTYTPRAMKDKREREHQARLDAKLRKERAELDVPVEHPKHGDRRTVNGVEYVYTVDRYSDGKWHGGLLGGDIMPLVDEAAVRRGRRFYWVLRDYQYAKTFEEAAQRLQRFLLSSHDYDRQQVSKFEAVLSAAPPDYLAAVKRWRDERVTQCL